MNLNTSVTFINQNRVYTTKRSNYKIKFICFDAIVIRTAELV